MNELDVIKQDMARASNDNKITAETNAIAFVKMAENEMIDEVTAAEHAAVFLEWEPEINYKMKDIRKYKESLFKCLQDHKSQEDWNPEMAVSLWKKIGDPTEEFPQWSQPIGAGDAYMNGDKVTFENEHYVSNIDNNVWQPGVYGWDKVN